MAGSRLDDTFTVSDRAHAMGGSTMFLTVGERPTVEELIKGIIVNSGNDACVVVAEGLAGTEEEFARKMNDRAKALGHGAFDFREFEWLATSEPEDEHA